MGLFVLQQEIAELIGALPAFPGIAIAPDLDVGATGFRLLYVGAHMKVDKRRMSPVIRGRLAFEVVPCERPADPPI